jgi:transcriptional regulator with XRE-family HTH domain
MIRFLPVISPVVNIKRFCMKKLTGRQIRAARGLLRISAEELAKLAHVGITTIRRAELEDGEVSMNVPNAEAVRRALTEAGVRFIEPEEGVTGPGVALVFDFDERFVHYDERDGGGDGKGPVNKAMADDADLASYWHIPTERGAALSPGSRSALSQAMDEGGGLP